MKPEKKYLDFFRREIKVGNIICYPTLQTSTIYQNWARVVGFHEKSIGVETIDYAMRVVQTKITRFDRCIIVAENITSAIAEGLLVQRDLDILTGITFKK